MKKRSLILSVLLAGAMTCNTGFNVHAAEDAAVAERFEVKNDVLAESVTEAEKEQEAQNDTENEGIEALTEEEQEAVLEETEEVLEEVPAGEDSVTEEVPEEMPVDEETVIEETPEEASPVEEIPEETPVNGDSATEEVTDVVSEGWSQDADGYWYWYENGEKVCKEIRTIDGNGYYFDYYGRMEVDTAIEIYDSETYEWRYYQADAEGKLVRGWYTDEWGYTRYFNTEEYYRYEDAVFEADGNLYYAKPGDGLILTSSLLEADGKLYEADANGILTERVSNQDGWCDYEGDWYYFTDRHLVKSSVYFVDGYGYFFDAYGKMCTDSGQWWADPETGEERYYYAGEDGKFVGGWYTNEWGDTYYFDPDRYYRYEDQIFEDNGKLYYVQSNGELFTDGMCCVDGKLYEADEKGVLTERAGASEGWQEKDGKWYYLIDGELVKDRIYTVDGKDYYFSYDGVMEVGSFYYYDEEQNKGGNKFADASGAIVHNEGWVSIYEDGEYTYYYVQEDGWLVERGFHTINGVEYYFYYSGSMATGKFWYDDGNGKSGNKFADASGAVINGPSWGSAYENGVLVWYYIQEDGFVAENKILVIDGKGYYFDYGGCMQIEEDYFFGVVDEETGEEKYYRTDATGVLLSGWNEIDYGKYYCDPTDFHLYREEFLEENGKKYYFTSHGRLLVSDTIILRGIVYNADKNGVLSVEQQVENGWLFYKYHWYYIVDGEMVRSQIYKINGQYYFFDGDGWMADGETFYCEIDGRAGRKYAREDGTIVNGPEWVRQGGVWFYVKEDGWLAEEEILIIDGKKYGFIVGGAMATSEMFWACDSNGVYAHYFADEDGHIIEVTETGWYEFDGHWYYSMESHIFVTNEIVNVNGTLYYFDYDGRMRSGIIYCDDDSYYADVSGAIQKNQWVYHFGKWYYAGVDGKLYNNGVYTINNQKYVFDYEGKMATGFVSVSDGAYITDENGILIEKEGWVYRNLHWYYIKADGKAACEEWIDGYYLRDDGAMATSHTEIDGEPYDFDENGICQSRPSEADTGWKFVGGLWYYYDQEGNPYTGWVDGTYYISDGEMRTNTTISEGKEVYYVRYDGKWVTGGGWYNCGYGNYEEWIYIREDGTLANDGWESINGKWYWFYSSGDMATHRALIEGKTEFFDADGAWIPTVQRGWVYVNSLYYYFDENGKMVYEGLKWIDGTPYYFDYDGRLMCNQVMYDGEELYYLDANGYRSTFTGWKQTKYGLYYADANGNPVSGLQNIGGTYYYFYQNGELMTGLQEVTEWGGWYLFSEDGYKSISEGWNQDAYGRWYYIRNGQPLSDGIYNIGGLYYSFNYDGALITGRDEEFVFSGSGVVRSSWYKHGNTWYYADANGKYVSGEQVIDGVTYWFDKFGYLIH